MVAVSLGAGLYTGTEAALKWAAAWLQVLGSAAVVFNNMGTQRRIGIDPMFVRIGQWLKASPPVLSGIPVFADLHIMADASSLIATGYAPTVEAGIEPAEIRLRQIERDIAALHQQLNAATTDFAEKVEGQRKALEVEKSALLDVRRTAENTRDAIARGIDLSTIGTWWLIVGIFVGMFPAEITAWLHPYPPPVWIWFGTVR
jgi:hypothetical protein